MPAPQVSNKAGNRQRGQQMEQQMAHDPQPMDTQPTETVDSPWPQSKKQQRDAERLQKWKAKQPASQLTARWQLLSSFQASTCTLAGSTDSPRLYLHGLDAFTARSAAQASLLAVAGMPPAY